MKLHILNDLHIEFGDFEPPHTDADVVVLAGDIGVGVAGVHWAASRFSHRPVIYVPGNHEFYKHDIALIDELKAAAPDHVHVLDNDEVNIAGGRFLGATLWTDFALDGDSEQSFAMQFAQQCMADFTIISNGARRFKPEDALKLHIKSRRWLASKLAEPYDGRTVVVTHHAPSARSIHDRYKGSPLSGAFTSNLENVMGADRVALWIHGHMHDSFDYEISGTRVVCNPRGYTPDELNPGFSADLTIEV
jgi:Icc-related predicted phosphoesterase